MSPEGIVAIATGTTGLTVFLLYLARRLGMIHEADDADVKAQRDALMVINREQAIALKELVDVVAGLSTRVKDLAGLVTRLVAKKL